MYNFQVCSTTQELTPSFVMEATSVGLDDGVDVSTVSAGSSFIVDHNSFERLNPGGISLHGRKNEAWLLSEALRRVQRRQGSGGQGRIELVLVSGKSGTGKSTLVNRTLMPDQHAHHSFVYVKFDQLNKKKSFTTIIGALSDVCDLIMQQEDRADRVRRDLLNEVGKDDVQILVQTIPSLSFLLGVSPNSSAIVAENRIQSGLAQAELRFQILCRQFLQACARHHTFVLFFDDCQWADDASIGVLPRLLGDKESHNLLLVCAFREENGNCQVAQQDFWLDGRTTKGSAAIITKVRLGGLGLENTHNLLSEILGYPESEQVSAESQMCLSHLAKIIHHKTEGNPYFMLQYLDSLVVKGLLQYDSEAKFWSWNVDRIQAETNVSENVAEIVKSKIQRLPKRVQVMLQIAACLGHTFKVPVLDTIVANQGFREMLLLEGDGASWMSLRSMLAVATQVCLIERGALADEFKFTHDSVQRCLYDVIGDDKDKMHTRIGLLLERGYPESPECVTFLMTDQLNLGVNQIGDEPTLSNLVDYNIICAKRSKAQSAFCKSGEYLRSAVSIAARTWPEREMWVSSYERCLEMYSELAEVEYSLGRFDESRRAINAILRMGRTLRDKQRAYSVNVKILGSECRLHEAMSLAIHVIRLSGSPFPQRPTKFQLRVAFFQALRRMKRISGDDILALPVMEDDDTKVEVEYLSSLMTYAAIAEEDDMFLFASLWTLRLTLRAGLTRPGCYALASFAMFLSMIGKKQDAFRLGMVVLKLLCRAQFAGHSSAANYVLGYVYHIRRPIAEAFQSLHQAYRYDLQHGNVEIALLAGFNAGLVLFSAGEPLPYVDDYLRDLFQNIREFQIETTAMIASPFWQAVKNLRGQSETPLILTGEVMCEPDATQQAKAAGNEVALFSMQSFRSNICGFMEEYERGEKLHWEMQVKPNAQRAIKSHFTIVLSDFLTALLWCARYRDTGRSKYRARARKVVRNMRRAVAEGTVAWNAPLQIVVAELMSLREHNATVLREAFDNAIEVAIVSETPHVEAVANEKAGNCMMHVDKSAAESYFLKASELYERWGAQVLVDKVDIKLAQVSPNYAPQTYSSGEKQ